MNYLVRLANAFMSIRALAATNPVEEWGWTEGSPEMETFGTWLPQLVDAIKLILWPLLIVVAAAGSIYAVILGVNMARADSTEKREEGKKRLINVLIGMAVIIGLILFMELFVSAILPAFLAKK